MGIVEVHNLDDSYFENEQNNEGDVPCLSGSLLGLRRIDIEDIYDLYCQHASHIGFSVRKSTTKYNFEKKLVSKNFVCSCEGKRDESTGSKKKPYITRTDCKASLKAKRGTDGLFEIVEHEVKHNHTLCRKELSYMHRSNRSISSDKAMVIENMISSGIRPIDSFRYMAHYAGGEHAVGHTEKDHLNFVNRLKMEAIDGGDAQTLIDILYQQSAKDPDFFFRVKLDDEGRLCNIFWRDSMMREDYEIFGDVVVFDTTYRTNKYNLICAPFVGINNHWKNVMFGCAFISNERIESFEWLFDVFRKSMGGRAPVSIFTDQDLAISRAIETIFPTTRHRLCIWHLIQNAISHCAKLKSIKSFEDEFQKCLSGCVDEAEFERCWSSMIATYGLKDHSWFKRMYELREKWCNALSKDYFSAGILSSQRSESTNSTLGFKARKTTSLTDFYMIFQHTVQTWRSKEARDEFQCSKLIPASTLSLSGLLKHASEVYTLTIFKVFEQEFIKSISTLVKKLCDDDGMKCYQVTDDKIHHVYFYEIGIVLVSCSCKKFEECGFLCCHCLRILHLHSITQIPHSYINRRWQKFVKQDVWTKYDTTTSEKSITVAPWKSEMMRTVYTVVTKAQDHERAREAVRDGTQLMSSTVDDLVAELESLHVDDAMELEVSTSTNVVKDPLHSNTKGRKRQRIKRYQKKKKGNSNDASKEFGTKTPNPRLF